MSDPANPSPPKPPTIKTSAVPLKKETVRITLRPNAPASEPLPAVPPPPPTARTGAPPPPGAPRPTGGPVPTVNLGAAPPPSAPRPTGPAPTGAPTIPLRAAPPTVRPAGGAGAPPPPTRAVGGGPPPPAPSATGSKTIPLAAAPAAARPLSPPASRPTSSVPGGAAATQPLPKATVKLQKPGGSSGPPSGPPTAGVGSAPVRAAAVADDEDEEIDEGPLNIAGVIAIVGSIAALLIAAMSWEHFPGQAFAKSVDDQDVAAVEEWQSDAVEAEATKLPADFNPFHEPKAQLEPGDYKNKFPAIMAARVTIPELVEN